MDPPLDADSERQARKLASFFKDEEFAYGLTSPSQAARRTCALAGFGRDVEIDRDLAEWTNEAAERHRTAASFNKCMTWDMLRAVNRAGETADQARGRADRLIMRLLTMDGTVAVFTHPRFGSLLAARWIGLPSVEAQNFLFSTATLSLIGLNSRYPDAPVIALWNAAPASFAFSQRGLAGPDAGKTNVAL